MDVLKIDGDDITLETRFIEDLKLIRWISSS
jgi:hypothetical protein